MHQPESEPIILNGPWGQRAPLASRLRKLVEQNGLSYFIYRYRYLACFTVIGFSSIVVELLLNRFVLRPIMPSPAALVLSFLVGMSLSFAGNAIFNFRVPRSYLIRSFVWFAVISTLSFLLNMATILAIGDMFAATPGVLRLTSAGLLFGIGYALHRRYSFDQARNFGLAVYACEAENVQSLYDKVGRNCDHVHIDLIDSSMTPNPSPVRLEKIDEARVCWPDRPFAMHVMSRTPRAWVEQLWDKIDWFLFHIESEDDLHELMFDCRKRGKKVGVVWRPGMSLGSLLSYLPHVDFAMVLGIREPGRSGQQMQPEAIEVVAALDEMRERYDFQVMFDGGVKTTNVMDIPAKYVIAASAVIGAENPVYAAHVLRSAAKFIHDPKLREFRERRKVS
jgi:pentose-5-phosphate-3-epimerase/putative flippase GtrA